MRCRDLMTTTVHACLDTVTAYRCAQLMKNESVGFVPVVDTGQHLLGVVTDRDLTVRVLAAARPSTVELREIMSADVVTCDPDEDLTVAEQRMTDRQVSRLVVVGPFRRCLGVLSLSDILRVEESGRASEVMRRLAARDSAPPPSLR
jgi:CBS domain-containing protein